jgi:hypothetical protein
MQLQIPHFPARAAQSKLHWAAFRNWFCLGFFGWPSTFRNPHFLDMGHNAMLYLSFVVPQDGTKDGCALLLIDRANFFGDDI